MAGTKDQQRAELVEGLALGLRLLGVPEIPSSKIDFEFAVNHALRRWNQANAYPSIRRAHKPDNEVWLGLQKSEKRKSAAFRFVNLGRSYVITPPAYWDPQEDDPIVGGRPNAQWRTFAELFAEWQGWDKHGGLRP